MPDVDEMWADLETADRAGDEELAQVIANRIREAEKGEGGFVDQLQRQAGLTARAALGGAAKTVTGIGDAANMALDEILRRTGSKFRFGRATPQVDELLTRAGLPEPKNARERVVGTAGEFLSGTGGLVKAGMVAPRLAEMARGPGMQAASAVLGGGAFQSAEESGASPGQKLTVSAGASLLPAAGGAGLRGLTRGRSPTPMRENIGVFSGAGTSPSVGQATQGRSARAIESVLSKTPGGAGPMRRTAERQTDEIANIVEGAANRIAPKATPERAGMMVERGIAGPGGFVQRFKERAGKLYDQVDQYIQPEQPVELKETQRFFAVPTAMAKEAPETARKLRSSFIEDLGVALDDDLKAAINRYGFEGLPYQAVKELRSSVGERLGNMTLVVDATKGQLKRLYGALSEDLQKAARQAGPQAEKAASRANQYWRAGLDRIENVERVVNKAGGPEKVYNALLSGTKDGATTLRTVMKSLSAEERPWVTAAVVRRMGKSTPGQQDAGGEAFSLSTYLTNWNRLSPEAKGALFAGQPQDVVDATNHVARVASNVREGSRVFANPSGTQPALSAQLTGLGAAGTLLYGDMGTFSAIMGGVLGANGAARLMTNRNFVNWLAKSTTMDTGAAINNLAQMAAQTDDEDMQALAEALQGVQQ